MQQNKTKPTDAQDITTIRELELELQTVELLQRINKESEQASQQAMMQAVMPYVHQMDGVKKMIISQKGLPGNWVISNDMTKLVRTDAPPVGAPQAEFTKKNPVRRKK